MPTAHMFEPQRLGLNERSRERESQTNQNEAEKNMIIIYESPFVVLTMTDNHLNG